MEHTKGEWKVDIDHQTHLTGKVTVCVGSISTGKDWDIIAEVEESIEALANAKLIAAAPDLLQTLLTIRSLTLNTGNPAYEIIGKMASKAIVKATQ